MVSHRIRVGSEKTGLQLITLLLPNHESVMLFLKSNHVVEIIFDTEKAYNVLGEREF